LPARRDFWRLGRIGKNLHGKMETLRKKPVLRIWKGRDWSGIAGTFLYP